MSAPVGPGAALEHSDRRGWFSAQSLDVVVVGTVAGAMAAGEYGAISRWTLSILLVVTAQVVNSFPSMSHAASDFEAWAVVRGSWLA